MRTEKDTLYHAFHRELRHMLRVHHAVCESRVKALGIHPAQHMLLMHLAEKSEISSQKELAEHMHISPAALAVSLGKLEAGGYIEKEISECDSRVKTLSITEKGRAMVLDSKRIFDGIDAETFKDIPNEALSAFVDVLQTMQANLTNMKEGEERK